MKKSTIKDGDLKLEIESTKGYMSIAIRDGDTYHTEPLLLNDYQIYELIAEIIKHKNSALGININNNETNG